MWYSVYGVADTPGRGRMGCRRHTRKRSEPWIQQRRVARTEGVGLNTPPVPEGRTTRRGVDRNWTRSKVMNGDNWIFGSAKAAYNRGEGLASQEFGKWVESLAEWRWFVTRTHNDKVDGGFTKHGVGSSRELLRDLVFRTEAERFVGVIEWQERGAPHVHAILAGTRAINGYVEQERDFNKVGISRWRIYKRSGGAAGYLGKYLTKDPVELYIGTRGPYSKNGLKGPSMGGLRV